MLNIRRRSLTLKIASPLLVLALSASAAHASDWIRMDAPPVLVDHDGRFMCARASLTQLSEEDQKEVVDATLEMVKNELEEDMHKEPHVKTIAQSLRAPKALDAMTEEAQKAIYRADTKSFRGLWPVGFMVFGGLGGSGGLVAHFGASGDLGWVIFPERVECVDTTNGDKDHYWKFDHSAVFLPHGHFGLGAGARISATVGASLIFGSMTHASDFNGPTIRLGASAGWLGGADATAMVVRNVSSGQSFFAVSGEFDWGPEAEASFDGEAGYIFTLGDAMTYLAKRGGSLDAFSNPAPRTTTRPIVLVPAPVAPAPTTPVPAPAPH